MTNKERKSILGLGVGRYRPHCVQLHAIAPEMLLQTVHFPSRMSMGTFYI